MGRRRYKYYEPVVLPPGYTPPATPVGIKDIEFFKYEPPPTVDDAATTDVDVDKAKQRLTITSDHPASATDHFIGVDTSSNTVTITLPGTAAEGKIYTIKDEGGNCSKNNLIIDVDSGGTIDGQSRVTIQTNYAAINVYYNGSGWHIY